LTEYAQVGRLMYIRKSMVKTFEKCPLRFKLEYVDKEPKPPGFVESQAIQFGTEFHEHAYRFFDDVNMKKMREMKTVDEMGDYFKSLLPPGPEYEWFAEFEARRYFSYQDKYLWMPYLREETLTAHDLGLTGTVDRVDILEPGTYTTFEGHVITLHKPTPVIIDYKTGTWSYNNPSEMRFELAFYAILLKHSSARIVTNIGGGIFPTVQKAYLYKLSPATFKAAERKVEKLKIALSKNEFERKPSALCDWCPYLEKCFGGDIDGCIETLRREQEEDQRPHERVPAREESDTALSMLWSRRICGTDSLAPLHLQTRQSPALETKNEEGLLARIKACCLHLREMWRGGGFV